MVIAADKLDCLTVHYLNSISFTIPANFDVKCSQRNKHLWRWIVWQKTLKYVDPRMFQIPRSQRYANPWQRFSSRIVFCRFSNNYLVGHRNKEGGDAV